MKYNSNGEHIQPIRKALGIIFWEADPKTFAFSYLSSQSEEILSHLPEAWYVGSTLWIEHIHPEDRDRVIDLCQMTSEDSIKRQFRFRLLDRYGSEVWLINFVESRVRNGAKVLAGLMLPVADSSLRDKQRNGLDKKSYKLADIGHWEVDLIKQRLYWSEEVKRLHEVDLDYEPNVDTAIKFYEEGEHRQAIKNAFNKAITEGENYDLDLKIITAKGNEKWIRTTGDTLWRNGQCIKVYGSTQDITKRKKNEFELERLSRVARETQNLVVITDTNQKIEWVNRAFEDQTGYTFEEVKGKVPGKILQGEDTDPDTVKRIAKNISEGKKFSERILNYDKDGTPYWIRLHVTPIKNEEDEITRFFSIQEIITEQVLAHQKVEEQTRRLNEAQQIACVGDWQYDVETDEISWSDMTYEIFERSKELPPPSFEELLNSYHTDKDQHLRKLVRLAISSGEGYDQDFEIKTSGGQLKYVRAIGIPVTDANGKVTTLRGIVQDITQRKIAINKLKENERKLRHVFNNTSAVFHQYKLNPDDTDEIIIMEGPVESLYEVAVEDILEDNQILWDMVGEQQAHKLAASIKISADQLTEWDQKYWITTPSGKRKCIHGKGFPKKLKDGSILWNTVNIDVTEQEKVHKEREEIYQLIEQTISEVYIFDQKTLLFMYVNDAAKENLDFSEHQLAAMTPLNLMREFTQKQFEDLIRPLKDNRTQLVDFTTTHTRADGSKYYVQVYLRTGNYRECDVFIAHIEDITEKKEARERNKILLEEVHHRVKNNLAIISGLLTLEMEQFDGTKAKLSLQRSINRIHSMAKVHELLYDSNDLSTIDISRYLGELSSIISFTFNNSDVVDIQVEADNIDMNINEAIPLGMLFNELITNSMKYAFDEDGGRIKIRVEENGEYSVVYRDNGRGMTEIPELDNTKTLGFTIINTLLKQLDASYQLDVDNKFELILNFSKKDRGAHSNL